MKTIYKKRIIMFLSVFLLLPAVSFAAEIFFEAPRNVFVPGEEFVAGIFLDVGDESVNAISGKVVVPGGYLDLKEIRDGNSAVNFWIERPYSASGGQIVFSGITAGGFSGPKNLIFSVVLRSKDAGTTSLAFADMQALLNDGIGTKAPISGRSSLILISSQETVQPEDISIKDEEPPESFVPMIANDPAVFDGKYFLVFATQDKGGGIGRYEVREGYSGEYAVAASPHILEDQSLSKNIYVKAIDKSGNEIIVTLKAPEPPWWSGSYLIVAVVILVGILAYRMSRRRR